MCHAEYSANGMYVQHINAAFAAASSALMELMMVREGLPGMLGAFKSYFLLARGDLFSTFLELAEAELDRNAADVTVTRLQSLLELGACSWRSLPPFVCLSAVSIITSRSEVELCGVTRTTADNGSSVVG